MPQMAPMYWMPMMIMILLLNMISMSMIYFNMNINKNFMLNNKKNFFTWKW